MINHYHFYRFNCLSDQKHSHRLFGHTEYMFGIGLFHFHFYYGSTSYNGHFHTYSGVTGFSIKTDCGHKHKISGKLNLTNSHSHLYENYTCENTECKRGKLLKKVLS